MGIENDKLEKWKQKNSSVAGYAHFDEKFGLNSAWKYITDCDKVKSHSFFPFISYDKVFYKVSKKDGKVAVKDKIRPICYSSHIDRCIYQYYGYMLNEKYNEYVQKQGIDESILAYRTNLHKNNIHFAKQAFDFIKQGECDIIVGDFKGFFDNLQHDYLKKMLCEVLCVSKLPNDWYAVYKNITKYSTWDLTDILKINGLITNQDIENKQKAHEKALEGSTRQIRNLNRYFDEKIQVLNEFGNHKKLALTKEQFKKHKKDCLKHNKGQVGIPQGSAISAVLSNVYMIEFDKKMHKFVSELDGLYLRYSDDFIIVLRKNKEKAVEYLNQVVKETENLTLEPKKTQIYSFKNEQILKEKPTTIDYLGFVFDGKNITIRQKTISKYYYRMYKKLNYIVKNNEISKNGNKISYKKLYNTYTQKGRNGQYDIQKFPEKIIKKDIKNPHKSGNFFSYVYKADKIFNAQNDKIEPITQSTKRHMLKIRRKRDSIKNLRSKTNSI